MGKLTSIVMGLAFTVAAAYGGYKYGQTECASSNYAIVKTEQGDMLKAKDIDKTYQIKEIDGDIFVGNADHNFKGAKTLTVEETLDYLMQSDTTETYHVD